MSANFAYLFFEVFILLPLVILELSERVRVQLLVRLNILKLFLHLALGFREGLLYLSDFACQIISHLIKILSKRVNILLMSKAIEVCDLLDRCQKRHFSGIKLIIKALLNYLFDTGVNRFLKDVRELEC